MAMTRLHLSQRVRVIRPGCVWRNRIAVVTRCEDMALPASRRRFLVRRSDGLQDEFRRAELEAM